ncbi:hypothetical protein [Actinokineospora sp. NBRC 105648]|uniref:hypothetical protein n=1 Tax=Actinokineospora sp. NBRC 105648 TaxID=3032206 RepID=UPI0024A56095|nr:hypothetical protein [Actinokineospora sp. NBRC 105648]GLZ37224.1 hypothetical protein Acsp05_08490 [Actinokineospora sp. NBRC 105648]
MTENETRALRHVAEGVVLFHSGLWGVPMGFLWAGADGSPAGRLPQWAADALTVLERRGLVVIRAAAGARDAVVRVTEAGTSVLGRLTSV